ncbi:conserved hypothetical protein [Flavobacterium sp. 9R]|uniref:T9SS type A sorting domain-containing protein n=1 Tax=Flavobacterium sp. 9R TaxID=2653143 RepID=UPI0012F12D35|nr:T9SS type A sorting domain-containing protein [Flavobacterium sp. 9R]VXB64383.1 conserved hypothetical protein [Flavobacterium sp. 9R]
MSSFRFFIYLIIFLNFSVYSQSIKSPIVLAYFPSWSESFAGAGQNSKLREIPSYVNVVFLSFAKPDLQYSKGSLDISKTGIEVPYDGCALKESIYALKQKGTKVILSIGGETFWTDSAIYSKINYSQIKDLVDDFGFAGIDWDFEPNGSFQEIGSKDNVQHFIDFFTKSRALMPRSEGYILACAPAGAGAMGGQNNDDASSPYAYAKRNALTGESDTNLYSATAPTNGISLFGFSSTGHMIPVFKAVGNLIDIVAFQGYNIGASVNRKIMYDSYAYYAEKYGFSVAAGIHYPNEPWGPYYEYNHQNVADLSSHIKNYSSRIGDNDGIMIWQLLLKGANSSSYSYLNIASNILNGQTKDLAIQEANNFSMTPYSSKDFSCDGKEVEKYCGVVKYEPTVSYSSAKTKVYYNLNIWENNYWANPNEYPGLVAGQWTKVSECTSGPDKILSLNLLEETKQLDVFYANRTVYYESQNVSIDSIFIFNANGQLMYNKTNSKNNFSGSIDVVNYSKGVYFVHFISEKGTLIKKNIF